MAENGDGNMVAVWIEARAAGCRVTEHLGQQFTYETVQASDHNDVSFVERTRKLGKSGARGRRPFSLGDATTG